MYPFHSPVAALFTTRLLCKNSMFYLQSVFMYFVSTQNKHRLLCYTAFAAQYEISFEIKFRLIFFFKIQT